MIFNIIIPTIPGREELLKRAVGSVECQRSNRWKLWVVHDNCDKEVKTVTQSWNRTDIFTNGHYGAGGCRNLAIDFLARVQDAYTLFLDDDDYIGNPFVLKDLENFIVENKYPDMVRVGYFKHYPSGNEKLKKIRPVEADLNVAVDSPIVGVSTKCIRNDKLVKFPEDVKHQDMVQHIAQCDICNTCAVWDKAFFVYSIYARPDKDPKSPECQKALRELPDILDDLKLTLRRESSRNAADKWKRIIKGWYGND